MGAQDQPCRPSKGRLRLVPLLIAGVVAACGAWAQVRPQGGTALSFETAPAPGAVASSGGVIPGVLWGPPPESSKGVVILVHGSSGMSDHPVGHYGRAFAAAGFTSYAIDSFTPRGISSTVESQTGISTLQMAKDAFRARQMLVDRGYRPDRFALMGFSKGGYATLLAMDRTFMPEEKERFQAALPWYPPCMALPRNPKPSAAVLLGIGDKDDYVALKPCQELAAAYRAAGGQIDIKVYPGGSHGFDGSPENTRLIRVATAENFRECVWIVEDDQQVTYSGKTMAPDAAFEQLLRNTCMRKGAAVWTDLRLKETATADAIAFVTRTLAP